MSALSFLDRERSCARPGYSRWLVPPAALAIHLSIGSVYAFSVFKNPLVERFQVSDTAIAIVFSIAIVMLGLSAAFGGTWMERNGPRKAICAVGPSASCPVLLVGGWHRERAAVAAVPGLRRPRRPAALGIGYISPGLHADQVVPGRPGLAPAWPSWASAAGVHAVRLSRAAAGLHERRHRRAADGRRRATLHTLGALRSRS
jgi:hypothetical protein